MFVAATCSTILAMLAYASGGETIQLFGNCGPIVVNKHYDRPVIIDASKAMVHGLQITGKNVDWRGGTLVAQGGMQGRGRKGYALFISGANVSISGATLTKARMGAVVTKANTVRFSNNRFWRLRTDGINASTTTGLTISNNRFEGSLPNPSLCYLRNGQVQRSVRFKDCKGAWADGDHPDAVQLRDGVANAVLEHNIVTGNTQGLTQMDTRGDAPLSNVRIRANLVQTSNYHQITLYDCRGCRIDSNTVLRARGSPIKAVIRKGSALRCGNRVQDEPKEDRVCAA